MDNDFDQITFCKQFWKKIQEEMRMHVIVEKKPKKKLKLYELHEEDINIDLQQVQQWSEDNSKLYYLIKENGFADFICNRESIIENYTQLIFNRQGIMFMDKELNKFNNLTVLRLNDNKIKVVENIPINLKELYLYSNPITHIAPKLRSEYLIFLGLGYCQLNDTMIERISQKFPNLKALDLTHNLLIDLESTVENIQMITSLQILSLYGNPFEQSNYQQYVISSMINLKYLDEVSTKTITDRLQAEENQKLIEAEQKKILEEQQKAEQEQAKLQDKNKKTGKGPQPPINLDVNKKKI